MGKTFIFAAVSLDGFIAFDDDTVGPLFDWYGNGDVEGSFSDEERVFRTTAPTADFLRSISSTTGAIVLGRRLFDLTDGWGGRPPDGEHAFVVTHETPTDWPHLGTAPFTFVTDGVRSGIEQARAFAGDRDVTVTAGDIGGQAIREGLVDQVVFNLVPAVLGSGRPFFGTGGLTEPVLLEDPRIVQGRRVTHLVYDVRR
jgi:dihydrofolate reductase